jgi:hypothetical protein
MATETICSNRVVIETRIFPSAGSMTIAASVGTRDVPNRLGRGHQSNVTGFAVVGDGAVIHSRRLPEASRVTVVAVCLNRNMLGRPARLGPIAGSAVAQITLEWRSYELPVHVAALTCDPLVFPREQKSRKVMIEGWRRLCRRGNHRMTALMGAASNGRESIVRILLDAGADRRMRCDTGDTALKLAESAGHQEIAQMIKSRKAGWQAWLGAGKSSSSR